MPALRMSQFRRAAPAVQAWVRPKIRFLFFCVLFLALRGATASVGASATTQFNESPITPGIWIFPNRVLASASEITEECWKGIIIQFQNGHYFGLTTRKRPPDAPEPRLSLAVVDEVGHCTFDQNSQTEHCDLAVTRAGATNKGFIDVRYSTENGVLKMSVTATTTDGPKAGKVEMLERYPVQCPSEVVRELMTVVHSHR
jgi:hypothetical protein